MFNKTKKPVTMKRGGGEGKEGGSEGRRGRKRKEEEKEEEGRAGERAHKLKQSGIKDRTTSEYIENKQRDD